MEIVVVVSAGDDVIVEIVAVFVGVLAVAVVVAAVVDVGKRVDVAGALEPQEALV